MKQDKRTRIIEAAREIFRQHGFKKSSVDSIAQLADVAKGTVYLVAESKEELYLLALRLELREWNYVSGKHIEPTRPADELLWQTASVMLSSLKDFPMVRAFVTGRHGLDPVKWGGELDSLRLAGLSNILEILRIGTTQGRFRNDIDTETVAALIQDIRVATILFYVNGTKDNQIQLERRFRASMDLLFRGIGTGNVELSTEPPKNFAGPLS